MDFLIVVNGQAGSAEEEAVAEAADVLRQAGAVEVAQPPDLDACAAVLREVGDRRLVLAGGDGTVHACVNLLPPGLLRASGSEVPGAEPVGLVPLGTGNDLARALGLPQDARAAAEVILRGRPRALDLADVVLSDPEPGASGPPYEAAVDGGWRVQMVNASHVGVGAAAAERSSDLKPRFGPVAYPLGALLAGMSEEPWSLTVSVDGATVHDGSALMVGIGNGPSVGGGAALAPHAVPDDGLLDVVVITALTGPARAAFGAALLRGAHLDRDDVSGFRGREIEIAGDAVVHDLDGELLGPCRAGRYRIRPGAWAVLVP